MSSQARWGSKARGRVFTGGGSLVKQFSPKLQLGLELTGRSRAISQLGKGQLQTIFGGNYQFERRFLSTSESWAGNMPPARAREYNLGFRSTGSHKKAIVGGKS